MKKFFSFLSLIILFLCGCNNSSCTISSNAGQAELPPWKTAIDDNQITIVKNGEFLEISVAVPQKNSDKFEEFDAYTILLTEAFADYLNISDYGEFSCPGLETVSEKEENNELITHFRIPEKNLKLLKK